MVHVTLVFAAPTAFVHVTVKVTRAPLSTFTCQSPSVSSSKEPEMVPVLGSRTKPLGSGGSDEKVIGQCSSLVPKMTHSFGTIGLQSQR